jgi:hypothetical protein
VKHLLADVATATETIAPQCDLLATFDAQMPEAAAPAKRAREHSEEEPATQESGEPILAQVMESVPAAPAPAPTTVHDGGALGNGAATRGGAEKTGHGELLGNARVIYDQLIADGYDEAEARAFAAEQQDETTDEKLVYALAQRERFSTKIFDEAFAETLETRIRSVLERKSLNDDVTVGLFQQFDANGSKHTILTIEFANVASAATFKGGQFKHEDVSFNVVELNAWLDSIGAIKNVGKRFAAVFGPWPFVPTFDTVDKYKGLLTSTYGDITNVTIYKDRTVTIGFALGERPMPKQRKPLSIMRYGQFMGTLHPTHNIRMLGVHCCLTCSGIGDFHGKECEENKRNFQAHMAKKKKLHAQMGARSRGDKEAGEWEKVKATHRGARGGSGRNAPVAQERSWADHVGA